MCGGDSLWLQVSPVHVVFIVSHWQLIVLWGVLNVRAEAENVTSTQKYMLQLVVYQYHSVVCMLVLNPYFSSVAPISETNDDGWSTENIWMKCHMTNHAVSQSNKMAGRKCPAAWALECSHSTLKEVTHYIAIQEMAACGTSINKTRCWRPRSVTWTNRTRTLWLLGCICRKFDWILKPGKWGASS